MVLIVMLKPTAIIQFGIPAGESFVNFVNGFFRLKAWALADQRLATDPRVPLKRQVILKSGKGGFMATVGSGLAL